VSWQLRQLQRADNGLMIHCVQHGGHGVEGAAYIPDDAACTLPGLRYINTKPGQELLTAVRSRLINGHSYTVSDIALWRKDHPAPAVACAIAIVQSQLKAADKFPSAKKIWAIPEAVEQASSHRVAQYKARKISALARPELIFDLCCGIGGDLLALAQLSPVIGVDISAVRACMARHNADQMPGKFPVLVLQADLHTVPFQIKPTHFFHIDPARRSSGKRNNDFSAMHPGPEIISELIQRFSSGVIKLSPAVKFSSLPAGHLELVSDNGTVVQALLWTGMAGTQLGIQTRTATVINDSITWSVTGAATDSTSPKMLAHQPEHWLYEVDGAVTRAGLAAALAQQVPLQWLSPEGGYLTGPDQLAHPALTAFEALSHFAYSESELQRQLKNLKLPLNPAGPAVEIKTRGGLGLDTDQLQKKLSKMGAEGLTVLIYRGQLGRTCVIARRPAAPTA
jgi:hypothetical protein